MYDHVLIAMAYETVEKFYVQLDECDTQRVCHELSNILYTNFPNKSSKKRLSKEIFIMRQFLFTLVNTLLWVSLQSIKYRFYRCMTY